ncbi:Uncharacterized protein dnm_088320 [Desulfonema magnum]|uniref:Uncharacterized protein n=1 Tax=Desulfonema magnum TaxID=45655 RepID=A0A975GU26_9BACT|nr:Uncharacterized protein dnm_088320 [Desulfonema magnum]
MFRKKKRNKRKVRNENQEEPKGFFTFHFSLFTFHFSILN